MCQPSAAPWPLRLPEGRCVMPQPGPWRWLRWVIAAAVLIAVLAVGGPYVYIHFISGKAPPPLSLSPMSK